MKQEALSHAPNAGMRVLLTYLVAGLLVIAVLGIVLRVIEPRMLYYPARGLDATPATRGWAFTEVQLTAADGTTLRAWWIPAPADTERVSPRIAVLLLHGNAGNRSHRLDKLAILRSLGADVLILDYRGYGGSAGRPDERGTYADARAAYEHLVRERGCDPRALVLHGESLGSAIAADLAAQCPVGGLVLEEAFTSTMDVAKEMFRFPPVGWLVRNRYDTLDRVRRVQAPVLILHSHEDEYFPFRHAQRLAAAARRARLVELRGGHNDAFLVSADEYLEALARFFTQVREGTRLP